MYRRPSGSTKISIRLRYVMPTVVSLECPLRYKIIKYTLGINMYPIYWTLTVFGALPSASASALIPSASTSSLSFCSIFSCSSFDAFFIAFFAAFTRARYWRYLSSVPKILSHHRKDVEKLLVKAMWWKSWCSAPDQKGMMLCNDQGKSYPLCASIAWKRRRTIQA